MTDESKRTIEERLEALEQRAGTTAARLGQLEDAVDDFTGGAYALDAARAARARSGNLERRVAELERMAQGGDEEGDEVARAFVDAGDAEVAAATRARRYSADLGQRAKLEQLVDRWRGAAERLREKDRTSMRFERDIAEAYETCADELFALLEEGV